MEGVGQAEIAAALTMLPFSQRGMLDLARRFGLDTVFVLPPKRGGDVCMRYFVPDHEMGVSGHAMVAGVTVAVNGKVRAVLSRAARSSERNEQLTQFVVTRY